MNQKLVMWAGSKQSGGRKQEFTLNCWIQAAGINSKIKLMLCLRKCAVPSRVPGPEQGTGLAFMMNTEGQPHEAIKEIGGVGSGLGTVGWNPRNRSPISWAQGIGLMAG